MLVLSKGRGLNGAVLVPFLRNQPNSYSLHITTATDFTALQNNQYMESWTGHVCMISHIMCSICGGTNRLIEGFYHAPHWNHHGIAPVWYRLLEIEAVDLLSLAQHYIVEFSELVV